MERNNEGIYSLGSEDGKEYVANVFWSDAEPGYVNFGVFAIESGQMRVIDSGFYDGYESIEDCVRDLAADEVMLKSPDIKFVADCSWETNSIEEYREALEEGKLEEPVPVLSWNQIIIGGQAMRDTPQHEELLQGIMAKAESAAAEKPDGKETFYFSYGTSDFFPFKSPGWVEVRASDRMEACEMYSSHFPKRDGLINCSFVYSEDEWQKAGMDQGGPGQVCCQVIDNWGPHREQSQGLTTGEFALEQMDRMRDSFQRTGFTRAMTSDGPQESALEDNLKQARDRAAEKNASRREPSEPRPSKGISR